MEGLALGTGLEDFVAAAGTVVLAAAGSMVAEDSAAGTAVATAICKQQYGCPILGLRAMSLLDLIA